MSWRDNKSQGGFQRRGRGRGGYRGGYQNRQYNKRPPMNQSHERKRTKFDVTNRLKEVDVGITEFMGDHDHFTGIVKERYHDFHVCEINHNGEIAKLTTQEIPSQKKLEIADSETSLPEEMLEKIKLFLKSDSDIKSIELDVTELNKGQRCVIHDLAKSSPSIVSQTIEKDGKKIMIVSRGRMPIKGGYTFRRENSECSWSDGNYCEFILHKVNIDTMNALNEIAIHLHLKPNTFNYAGTKDRRASTSQWVSLRRVAPTDILRAAKKVRGVFVGNFKFVDKKLELGSLKGNRFTIALRNVTAPDEEIDKAMTSLRDNGFINYYGLQRFGTVADIPTHDIGKALLQAKWEEAVDLILKPRDGDQHDLAEARETYSTTKDAGAALQKIQRRDKIEAKLLEGLKKNGTNLQGALDFLPRNTRLMYIHAYQSFVWNNIVSRRIKEYGRKPIVGDLVYETSNVKEVVETLDYSLANEDEKDELTENLVEKKDEDKPKENELADNADKTKDNDQVKSSQDQMKDGENQMKNNDDQMKEDNTDQVNKIEIDTADDNNGSEEKMETEVVADAKDSNEKKEDLKNDKNENGPNETENGENTKKDDSTLEKEHLYPLPNVKILTEEDLPNYTLADVVMPQPGWRVVYPPYAKAWYEEFLASDGLNTNLKQKNKKYSLSGAYRKILEIPEDLSWRVMHYKDLRDDLIPSDINELRGNPVPKDCPDGKYKALILEMSLKSSCYATMALREVLKHDTSAKIQAAQSAAYHAQDEAENKELEENSSEHSKSNEVENAELQMEVVEEKIKDLPMEEEPREARSDFMESKTDNAKPTKTEGNLKSKKLRKNGKRCIQYTAKEKVKEEVKKSFTDEPTLENVIKSRTTYCRAIQVSTRGVGLAVTWSAIIAKKMDIYSHIFPLHSMYRVMLAFTEEKLALVFATNAKKLADPSAVYNLTPNAERVALLSRITAFPKFATAYIEGLGTFTHEGLDFVPVLPQEYRPSKKAKWRPDPGKIIFSNLRTVVTSMRSKKVPPGCRRTFARLNPIPNVEYNEANFMIEDNIMPDGYNNYHLQSDIVACNKVFNSLKEQPLGETWIGGCPSLKSPKGMPGVAVIQPRMMKIPSDKIKKLNYNSFRFEGVQMLSPIPLQTSEWLRGATCLYREPPRNLKTYPYYPYWDGCTKDSNPYGIIINPTNIFRVLFDMKSVQ
ncbi:uncharacterized protein Pus7 [Chelonus insularis]|uniref:uncharacterized protein Pus7 n=1 Tax=Chelonus insularis TaxID=460826 RepID=UPI00158DAF43|nr:uncharacterized protein LOC118070873 [Chelonus insularis]